MSSRVGINGRAREAKRFLGGGQEEAAQAHMGGGEKPPASGETATPDAEWAGRTMRDGLDSVRRQRVNYRETAMIGITRHLLADIVAERGRCDP